MKRISVCTHVLILILVLGSAVFAQTEAKRVLTADDYARAEKMLGYNTGQLIDRGNVRPTFLPDGRFWYRVLTPTTSEYVMVWVPPTGSGPDHDRVGAL